MEKKILFWFYWEMYFLFINSISFVKLTTASSLLIYCILFNFIYLAKYPLSLLQKSCFICCLFHPNCKWVPLNHLNQYHSYKCQNSHSYLSILFSIWIRSEALLLKKIFQLRWFGIFIELSRWILWMETLLSHSMFRPQKWSEWCFSSSSLLQIETELYVISDWKTFSPLFFPQWNTIQF